LAVDAATRLGLRRGQTAQVRTAGIAGIGSALPERAVASADLAAELGVGEEWITRRTGILSRRLARPEQRLSELAARAGEDALHDAGLEPRAVDMLLVATVAADDITPACAPLVADLLGARSIAAFDVGAACAGFLAALAQAVAAIEAGRAENVLVVGAELLSRFVDWSDRRTAPLFGDGAGAALVTTAGTGGIGRFVFGCDGGLSEMIRATRARGTLEMQGHETFLAAVEKLSSCTRELLELERLGLDDIDLFVYHQANGRILSSLAERLGVERERVFDCIAEFGNTSAASIPLALGEAVRGGQLRDGQRVLVAAIGAGMVWGATTIEWERP